MRVLAVTLTLALVLLLPILALAAPAFPPLTGRVVDNAHLLSPAARQKLTDELAALEQKTGHQLVVATVPDLQGYEIEDYGYQLLRTWAIGRKGQNDGAILIVAPGQKKVRVEVGYGLEPVLTDALSRLIIERTIIPAFKTGNYEQGVVDGTEAIAAQLGLPEADAKAEVAAAAQPPVRILHPDNGGGGGLPIIFVVIVVVWVLSGILRVFGGRRRGGGSGLWWLLPLILSNSGRGGGSGWSGGGGGWSGGGGGGGFSGGGGSGGGGGASGSW